MGGLILKTGENGNFSGPEVKMELQIINSIFFLKIFYFEILEDILITNYISNISVPLFR